MCFEWRVARVTAVTRRALGPDRVGPSSIFICAGELEKVVGHFYGLPLHNRDLSSGQK